MLKFVNVSLAVVGGLCVLQTKVVPAGFVPVFANDAKFTVVVGQVLLNVGAVMAGAVVPAKHDIAQFPCASNAAVFALVPTV